MWTIFPAWCGLMWAEISDPCHKLRVRYTPQRWFMLNAWTSLHRPAEHWLMLTHCYLHWPLNQRHIYNQSVNKRRSFWMSSKLIEEVLCQLSYNWTSIFPRSVRPSFVPFACHDGDQSWYRVPCVVAVTCVALQTLALSHQSLFTLVVSPSKRSPVPWTEGPFQRHKEKTVLALCAVLLSPHCIKPLRVLKNVQVEVCQDKRLTQLNVLLLSLIRSDVHIRLCLR